MKTYSLDLRQKVMKAVDRGDRVGMIAKNFGLDEKTIYLWRKQRKERGHIEPITKYQKGHHPKITDLKKFEEFVRENASCTTKELTLKWGNIGLSAIKKYLKKIGFTRKKRLLGTKIAAKKNCASTRSNLPAFQKKIAFIWTKPVSIITMNTLTPGARRVSVSKGLKKPEDAIV